MGKSKIEWTDETWNPVVGCSKVSQGCKFCYAERVFPRAYPGRKFTDVTVHEDRLGQPLRWKRPRKIFVNSMSDLFHESVSDEFLDRCFEVMALAPRHTFQILTKRPERMATYMASGKGFWEDAKGEKTLASRRDEMITAASEMMGADGLHVFTDIEAMSIQDNWPFPNVWLGVSVEDQATADERIPLLLKTPAAVRWVSYEPALGPVDFDLDHECGDPPHHQCPPNIDWIVAGGESGPHARPSHPDWYRAVRDQCQAAGVPFFFKQWGELIPPAIFAPMDWSKQMVRVGKKKAGSVLDGREWKEYPVQSCTTKA